MQTTKFSFAGTARRKAAFTLVEVAMAIGILSFSLVAIMGLIPVALQASKESIDKSLELEMLQVVRANLLNTPYSDLQDSGRFLFDADAAPVDDGAEDAKVRYRVDYINAASTSLPSEQTALNLRTSRVRIQNAVTGQVRESCLYLPDNGL